jgi:hypothetical protein
MRLWDEARQQMVSFRSLKEPSATR